MDNSRDFEIPKRSHVRRKELKHLVLEPNETEETFCERQQHLEQIFAESLMLKEVEESLKEELCERLWITMYLQHFANRIMRKDKVEIVLKRKRDAQIGKEEYWNSIDVLANVLKSDVQGQPKNADIAFRVFTQESFSPYSESRGNFRCENWKHFDISKPMYRSEAEKHISGFQAPTNYVSISTSPGRSWNYIQKASDNGKTNMCKLGRVAIIDLRVLERFGIAYGSTTDNLKFQHWNDETQTGTKFATKHHCLVLGWLPSQCILGYLSIKDFKTLLDASCIKASKSALLSEFEKKISFAAMESYFSLQEQVALSVRQ